MGSEEGLGAAKGVVMKVLDDRPSDGDTVIGTRTSPEFVEEDE